MVERIVQEEFRWRLGQVDDMRHRPLEQSPISKFGKCVKGGLLRPGVEVGFPADPEGPGRRRACGPPLNGPPSIAEEAQLGHLSKGSCCVRRRSLTPPPPGLPIFDVLFEV